MDFKIRCSSISSIVTEPRLKTEKLSDGAKTYCKKWLKEQFYNRYQPLDNKYVNKGLEVEEDAFTLLAVVLNIGMVYKNTERKTDEFITGECDLYHKGIIYDNKASYSLSTFPMFEDKPDPKYYWQGQGYMHLWGSDLFKLCYTLIDCPLDILERDIRWLDNDDLKQQKASDLIFTQSAWDVAKQKLFPNAKDYNFIEIPKEKRVKVFDIPKNNDDICKIVAKTKLCKEFVNSLI